MNFKLLLRAHLYPSSRSHLLQGLPLTWMRTGPWPVRWHSHRGHCSPPACTLTDSKAVIELEAAEHLVDISRMIKAVASHHNLKGFCKLKNRRFIIYLWEITQIQLFCSEWPKLKHDSCCSLPCAWNKTSPQTLPLFSSNVQECCSASESSLCLKSAPTGVTHNCNALKVPQQTKSDLTDVISWFLHGFWDLC